LRSLIDEKALVSSSSEEEPKFLVPYDEAMLLAINSTKAKYVRAYGSNTDIYSEDFICGPALYFSLSQANHVRRNVFSR
jgi:hypothetical protein